MNLILRYCLTLFTLLCLSYTVSAQEGSYEDEYDDEYDYNENNYNNNYYERYSEAEYRKRNERFYKKSYKEEDLYNGGYRSKSNSENYAGSSIGGWSLFNFGKSSSNDNENPDAPKEVIPKKFNRYEGIENGVGTADNDGGVTFNDGTQSFEPGKGQQKPNDPKDEQTPPPPDDPDSTLPVDTAIPFLLVAAVLLVSFKFGLHKKASV